MQTERNSSGGVTGGKHWSTLALAACGVSVLILGCVEHQVWTPYAQQPAPTRALDGQEVPLVSLPASTSWMPTASRATKVWVIRTVRCAWLAWIATVEILLRRQKKRHTPSLGIPSVGWVRAIPSAPTRF